MSTRTPLCGVHARKHPEALPLPVDDRHRDVGRLRRELNELRVAQERDARHARDEPGRVRVSRLEARIPLRVPEGFFPVWVAERPWSPSFGWCLPELHPANVPVPRELLPQWPATSLRSWAVGAQNYAWETRCADRASQRRAELWVAGSRASVKYGRVERKKWRDGGLAEGVVSWTLGEGRPAVGAGRARWEFAWAYALAVRATPEFRRLAEKVADGCSVLVLGGSTLLGARPTGNRDEQAADLVSRFRSGPWGWLDNLVALLVCPTGQEPWVVVTRSDMSDDCPRGNHPLNK